LSWNAAKEKSVARAYKEKVRAEPFVPQNTVVGPGTQVVWFRGAGRREFNE
jgi:hypothetical protein